MCERFLKVLQCIKSIGYCRDVYHLICKWFANLLRLNYNNQAKIYLKFTNCPLAALVVESTDAAALHVGDGKQDKVTK
jgi:hypothetical protein